MVWFYSWMLIPFLRNIYGDTDIQKMEIDGIEKYYEIFDRLVDLFPVVGSTLEDGDVNTDFEGFMSEELDNLYSTTDELKETIGKVVVAKKRFVKTDFADIIIIFIYSSLIKFAETDKIKGIPMSKNFTDNLK